MSPVNEIKNIVENNQSLITTTILTRKDECIIMNKKELTMTDNFSTTMDVIYDVALFFSSAFLGFMLGLEPAFTKLYIGGWIFTIVVLFISIFVRIKKTSTISEILKMYNEN